MKAFKCNKETAIVSTSKGRIRGYEYDGLSIFKAVPYARARRFHSPVEMEEWEGVLDCTSYGYVCPLLSMSRPNGELRVPHRYWVMDEHCQNLNIWTPACDEKRRPVLVWLHGGGFEAGSAIEHQAYEGENMSRLADLVVVSVNHRLNVLGYFDLSDFGEEYENSGNAGTEDIIAALRWIHDNIIAFGGDPDQVTIMGQSGGGAKVTTLLQSPKADGLYHRGIIMSGNYAPLLHDSIGSGREFAEAIMEDLGIETIEELESIKYDRLAESYLKLRPIYEKQGKNVGSSPHPNSHYLGLPPITPFRDETKEIPLLIGTVFGEMAAFVSESYDRSRLTREDAVEMIEQKLGKEAAEKLIPLFEKAYPERHLVDLLTVDFMFRAPNIPYVLERAKLNTKTYYYLFNHNTALDYERVPWHCFDVPFAFHNIDMVPTTMFSGAEELQEAFFRSFVSFIRTGDPNHEGVPEWLADTGDTEHIMIFGENIYARDNHDHELMPAVTEYLGPVFSQMMKKDSEKAQH